MGNDEEKCDQNQPAFYAGRRAQRSISPALFSKKGPFCAYACANEMEGKVSGSTCQKRGKEMCR